MLKDDERKDLVNYRIEKAYKVFAEDEVMPYFEQVESLLQEIKSLIERK